jgi:hypothetical protein
VYHWELDTPLECRQRQQLQRQVRSRIMGPATHSQTTWADFPTLASVRNRPPTPIPSELELAFDTDAPLPSAPPAADTAPVIPKFVAEALKRDAVSKGESCPITMIPVGECSSVTMTSCYHLFEAAALERWMTTSSTCPVCKQEVASLISV